MKQPEKRLKAIYAGSFDPPTLGHLDVVQRCSSMFEQLEINIAINPKKKPFFEIEKRVALFEEITHELGNVAVRQFTNGLIARYASDNGFRILVRGLRSERDLADELPMLKGNTLIAPDVETVFIPARPALDVVSSSLVKDILAAQDPSWPEVIAKIVPEPVLAAIHEKVEQETLAGA